MSERDLNRGDVSSQESDESLRRVYGEHAIFSRVDTFTLVHLDSPSAEEIKRRIDEFNPDEFFFDDCPLCVSARADGGHIVFDGPDCKDALRDGTTAEKFETSLARLTEVAERFAEEVTALVPHELASRFRDDVVDLHDRLIETLWSQTGEERVQTFERQVSRALLTLASVCETAPSLTDKARGVEETLGELTTIWRST